MRWKHFAKGQGIEGNRSKMDVLNGFRASAKSTKDIKYLSWNFISALKISPIGRILIHLYKEPSIFFSGALLFNELLVQLLFLALSMRIYCTRRKGWRTKWNGNICEVCIYYSDGFDSIWPPFILLPHLFFCYFLHFICQSLCHFEMYFTRVPFIHVDTLTEKK